MIKKKIWQRMKQNNGFTMVELIVCFALLMLFIGAAASVLSTYMRVTNQVSSSAEAQTVCDALLNKVQDFLVSADSIDNNSLVPDPEDSSLKSGDHIQCKKGGVRYTIVKSPSESDESKDVISFYPEDGVQTKGYFIGDSSYMGNFVDEVKFSIPTDTANKGFVTVEIKLNSLRGPEYTDSRTFRCNFSSAATP